MHGLLKCLHCEKVCNTLLALRKHLYMHTVKADKFSCEDCGKSYPFPSQLKLHRKVHLTALEHHCLKCDKSFKNKGELIKHQNVHSGKKWRCQRDGCDYECTDPRNLCAHMHSHNPSGRYKCDKCQKWFKYYMQLKHHQGLDCINIENSWISTIRNYRQLSCVYIVFKNSHYCL